MITAEHRRTFLCGLALSLAADAAAHTVPVERIEVPGHYDNSVGSSDAASQGTISAKLIEARPLARPGEVLELVPGVVITQHSGAGKANQYFLRGFNLDHGTDFATTVAGMPVNMPSHGHGQGYSDLNFMIPELITRIAYRKGPYFATHGDFASAGAADIVYGDRLPASIAEASLGGFGFRRGLLAGSGALSAGNLLYGLELARSDGPWENPDDLGKVNAVLRWSHESQGTRTAVSAMAYRSRWNATDQIPQRAVDDGRLGRFGAVDSSDGGETSRYSVSLDTARTLGAGVLEANAYFLRYRLNLFSNFTYFLDDPERGDQFEQLDRRSVAGANARWVLPFSLAGREAVTTLGVQARDDRIDAVGLFPTVERERVGVVREDQVRQSSVGLFAEQGLQVAPWLRVVAGLRHDAYRFDVRSDRPENSGKRSDNITSPKASVVFQPAANTEIFLNAGRGFHSNDARGTTATVDPKTGEPVAPVDPLVRTRGQELGLKTDAIPGLQASVSLWRLDIDSELLFVGDAGTTEASRPAKRDGVELSLRYVPRPWLLFDLDLARSRARFTDDDPAGSRVPGAIDRVATAGVTLRDLGPWSASAFVRHFGARPLVEDGSVMSKASTLVNGRLAYAATKDLRFTLEVFNMLDREANDIEYFYASRLRGESSASDDLHIHPAEPRTWRLGVQWRFR